MTRNEIDIAIQRAFDGTLAEAECVALRAILKSDLSARALYCEYAGVHQALIYRLSPRTEQGNSNALMAARSNGRGRNPARWLMAAAAAVILCAGLAFKLRPVGSIATFQGAFGSRFTVGNSGGSKVGNVSGKLRQGDTVNLSQGAVEVVIQNGSRGIVLAPALFTLQSDNRIILEQGTAWFHVGKMAHGFQVVTPRMAVTDLGTEFGVISQPDGGAEVHVFSGQVESAGFDSPHSGAKLSAGEARRGDASGSTKQIDIRPEDFLMGFPGDSATGLIANGDFEAGNHPLDGRFGSGATPALLPSWSCGDRISVAHRDNTGRLGYGEDGNVVVSPTADVQIGFQDDTVGRPAAEAVSIRQSFTTEPGVRYAVEFQMGAYFLRRDTALEITASVRDGADPAAGELLAEFVEQRSPSAGTGYNAPVTFAFTAKSDTTTLVFAESSINTDDADPVIDNISVRLAK